MDHDALLTTLKERFEKNMARHKGLSWEKVQEKLMANPKKIETLLKMEKTGGEPDVVGMADKTGEYLFCDCSLQSPTGRRSLCFDRQAWEARKEHKPKNTVIDVAAEIGIKLLSEDEYRSLQKLGEFDTTTSSWVETPSEIRNKGGAIFCDRRYDTVFMYHNGADSYYASRGFRGSLRV